MTDTRQVLSLTLFRDAIKTPTPWRIVYNGIQIILTEDQYEDLLSRLPEFWNTDNDKLILFRFFSDDSYFCERFKQVYNYSTKQWEEISYIFDAANPEEVSNLFNILAAFYQEIRLQELENITAELEKNISDLSIVKVLLLNTRQNLLDESDYLFTTDYPISEEERAQWASYRQELRDITTQDAWIDNDYANIKMPLSPNTKNQTRTVLNILESQGIASFDTLSESASNSSREEVEEFISNVSKYYIKQQIVTAIAKLGLPLSDISLGTKYGTASLGYQTITNLVESLDEMKQKIDNQLQEIGSNLTFNLILQKYASELSGNQDPMFDEEIEQIIQDLRNTQED